MTPQSAKSKGRTLQQWACAKISELINLPWGHDCPIESRGMGQNGVDVRLDDKAIKLFPFSVECKNCERWNVPEWIEQAKTNQKHNTDWLLIAKKNHVQPVVIIDAEAFFRLLR